MKRIKLFVVMITLFVAGCCGGPSYPPEFRGIVKANEVRNRAYLRHMDKGETTREQDKQMIQANAEAWAELQKIMESSK